MASHTHARLTRAGRVLLVDKLLQVGWTASVAAQAEGVNRRTAYKWLARFGPRDGRALLGVHGQQVFRHRKRLTGMGEALIGDPAFMGLGPLRLGWVAPAVAQQEGLELLPSPQFGVHRIFASTAQVTNTLMRFIWHPRSP